MAAGIDPLVLLLPPLVSISSERALLPLGLLNQPTVEPTAASGVTSSAYAIGSNAAARETYGSTASSTA